MLIEADPSHTAAVTCLTREEEMPEYTSLGKKSTLLSPTTHQHNVGVTQWLPMTKTTKQIYTYVF